MSQASQGPLPEHSTEQLGDGEVRAWERLTREVRRVLEGAVTLQAHAAAVDALADRAAGLADALASASGAVPMDHVAGSDPRARRSDELDRLLPFSPITGRFNPIAPPLHMSGDEERVVGEVRLGSAYQGAPGVAHGAVVAGIWDEVLAMATVTRGLMGPTAVLEIRYRRPTPLYVDLRFESRVERVEGRRVYVEGTCHHGDEVVSTAEAIFIRMDPANPHPDWQGIRREGEGTGSE